MDTTPTTRTVIEIPPSASAAYVEDLYKRISQEEQRQGKGLWIYGGSKVGKTRPCESMVPVGIKLYFNSSTSSLRFFEGREAILSSSSSSEDMTITS